VAEEIKQEQQTAPPVEAVQLTDVEQRASNQGWVPQDVWEGDPEQWRPAKEFIDRGELFKKIDDQNRIIKDVRRTLDEFGQHHSRVKETEYKRALADLKARKKEALSLGDADAVVEIDEALADAREAQKIDPTPAHVNLPDPTQNVVFQSWVNKNSWYENNEAMRAYADRLGNKIGATESLSPTELLSRVEQAVKKEFAHKFNNPNRDKPGAVDAGGIPKGGKGKDTFVLNDDVRRAMQKFVKTIPGYTEEKYITELRKVKGIS
jgi:hypothetical protein